MAAICGHLWRALTLLALLSAGACGGDPAGPDPQPAPTTRQWQAVTARTAHTCALDSEGTAYCWGSNLVGQLGVGGEADRSRPTAVAGSRKYRLLSAGDRFTCGLDLAGAAWCWGDSTFGQLGSTATGNCLGLPCSRVPAPVSGGRTYTTLAAGGNHVCGLDASGSAWCWGDNGQGQLGVSGFAPTPTPVAVQGGLRFSALTAGQGTTCGTVGTAAYCWGLNSQGQLGRVTSLDVDAAPGLVSGGHAFATVHAAGFHVCGRTTGGQVRCWGANELGELGIGSTTPYSVPVTEPQLVAGLTAATALAAGNNHNCAVLSGGEVRCWGANAAGQLGASTATRCGPQSCATLPAARVGTQSFTIVAAGGQHSCALTGTGNLYCWGSNDSGQLALGSAGGTSSSPVEIALP
jgi:alpha-tubulin suppressor-like RCC1 family protein